MTEGRRSHLHQRAQSAKVVRCGLAIQTQRRPWEADAAQRLATHLLPTAKHLLHTSADRGDTLVASSPAVRQRLTCLALALDVHPPALRTQALLARALKVASVRIDVAARVAGIEHPLEVQGVVLASRADVHATDQLVAPVRSAGELEAGVALAVLLAAACLHVLLPPLRGRPLGWHRVLLHERPLVLVQRLLRNRHDAGVDHPASTRGVAMAVELPAHDLEDALSRTGLNQSLLERPDRRSVGRLRTLPQPHEALKAQTVLKLELRLLIAEVVEPLHDQHTHHQPPSETEGVRHACAQVAAPPRRSPRPAPRNRHARPVCPSRRRSCPSSSRALAPRTG